MRTSELTSEECERLNTEERMYLNRYADNAKRIMKKPVGERYSMLSNLCKMIVEDQSDWLDNDMG